MEIQLKYMPILRARREESKVLKTFDFENNIYPCVEIIRELDRVSEGKVGSKKSSKSKTKQFEDVYVPLIGATQAKKVFIDIPIHLQLARGMQKETITFLTTVARQRSNRTKYIQKLKAYNKKIIPVISSFYEITGEQESIKKQETEFRKDFDIVAFRTFPGTFLRDLPQIKSGMQTNDYLIMDWGEMELDSTDGDQQDILNGLQKLKGNVIVHRNPFPLDLTNSGLEHGKKISNIDNSLMDVFKDFGGTSFSDYSGIKKDSISGAPISSPGFIFYDAVENSFYGYRYKYGGHKQGEKKPDLAEFETRIVPDVIASDAAERMENDSLDYLGSRNGGWNTIKNIELGEPLGESGKSPAKFKRIGIEHYLHCVRTKIANGDFD